MIRESSQGDNLLSRLPSYKLPSIRGLQEPAKTQRLRERSGSPGRTPHSQMFLAMFSVEVSLGAERGGWHIRCKSCRWHTMCIGLIATGRPCRLHRDLLPTPYSQHQDGSRRPRRPHISQLRRMSAHVLHMGPMVTAPFPYSSYGTSHHRALGPVGCEAESPKAGRAFPQSPEQELVLTPLLAVNTCCWCRNNPSRDSGAAFVRCS